MSRILTSGVNPENGESVSIAYGYDVVLTGVYEGYFFQVNSRDPEIIKESEDGEGILVNEGFLDGISQEKLTELMLKWKAEEPRHQLTQELDTPKISPCDIISNYVIN